MTRKLTKVAVSTLHPRDRRSRRHGTWKRNVSRGMREARLRRREIGLMTFQEVATDLCLPVYSIKKMVELEQLPGVEVGTRRYIRRAEVEAWKKQAGLSAA